MSTLTNRNLWILFSCQLVSVSSSMIMVTLAGILGGELAGNPALATLPISLMIVGTALTTIPAALAMKRIGRRAGFSLAALAGAAGTALCAIALIQRSFLLLCAGLLVLGANLAFVQQYRFAAAESVPSAQVGHAVSLVLLGSIGGALLGPELVTLTRGWVAGTDYAGTMYALSAALVGTSVLLLALRNQPPVDAAGDAGPARPLGNVLRQPVYLVAVFGGVVAYGVMTFIMTATPVSMHVIDGHTMEHTAGVVRSHVIAMYAPSLISGFLIARLGTRRLMAAGAVAMLVTVVVGLRGHAVVHYWWALIALGIGWNFLYIGATTLLTRTYQASERFRAQAVNDFSIFAMSAAGSLLAGTAIHLLGWLQVLLAVVAPLLLMLVALYMIRGDNAHDPVGRPLAGRD